MNEFDKLRESWNAIEKPQNRKNLSNESVIEKLISLQRKIVFGNLFASIGLVFAMLAIAWVYSNIDNITWKITASVVLIFALLLYSLINFWKRTLFWNNSYLTLSTKEFAIKMIRKLKFNKWMTNVYLPIYLTLLGSFFILYYYDVLSEMEMSTKVLIYALTIAFIVLVGVIGISVRKKKNRQEIDPLISQLQTMLDNLSS